jgi:EAL domain-containing protein (putative c-di-GMP-specific phosphodiesterase class I)
LRKLGVGIAMDDFGTGFSSLSALQRFPFTKVKIDRAFVRNLGQAPESAALLRAIVDLCKVLQIPTVAEGVETEEQFATVSASGCAEVQGFLFGYPLPMNDLVPERSAELVDVAQRPSCSVERLMRPRRGA